MLVAVRGLMLSRQLSWLTGRSAVVAGGCLVVGEHSLAERGRRSGEAVATTVAQCVGQDHRRIEAAELPSESSVTAGQPKQSCLAQRSADASEDRALVTKCAYCL